MKKPVNTQIPAEANRSDYVQWLSELKLRCRNQQLKASAMVNHAALEKAFAALGYKLVTQK